MAKRKKGRGKGGAPAGADATGTRGRAEVPAPVEPEAPLEPLAALPRGWIDALAVVALLGAVLAVPDGELAFPGLWDLGRGLAVAAGLALLAAGRLAGPRRQWASMAALGLSAAALMALYGRHPELHLSPFQAAHPGFVGFPSALAFAMLAAGSRALARQPGSAAGRAALVVGTLWGAAVLLFPWYWLGETSLPIELGLDLLSAERTAAMLGGFALCLQIVPVGAGVASLVSQARRDAAGLRAWRPLLEGGAWVLVGYHLAAPLVAGEGTDGGALLAGVLLAALLAVLVLAGSELLAGVTAAEPPEPQRRHALRALDLALPAIVVTLYGLLKTHGMGPSNTDENIYFYMAADLANGRWPYVDYFFAHPPMHVLVPGTFFAIFGYSLTFAKLFSALAGGIAGLAVWAIGRRHLGRVAGVVAMIAFLFACETLKATTNMTGINLTTMWLMLGMWASLRGSPLRAGAFMGLAATTGFYSMAAICALLLLGAFRDRRFALRQLGAFAAVFGAINLLFWLWAGDAFVDGVYRYHGLKRFQEPDMVPLSGGDKPFLSALVHNLGVMVDGRTFTKEIYYHGHLWITLFIAPLLGLFAYFADPGHRRRPWRFLDPRRLWQDGAHGMAGAVWLVGLALFIQFSMFRELYSFYFTLIYPVLALLIGYLLGQAVRLVLEALADPSPDRLPLLRILGAVTVLVGFSLWHPWSTGAGEESFPDEVRDRGKVNPYVWSEAPVLTGLSDVVRALFWEDQRLKGNMEPGYSYYLWTKKRMFESLDEVATYIRENSQPNETIAGGSTMAPLVALAAERRLAADEVDTNSKRFKTGMLDEVDYWRRICEDQVRFLVAIPRSYFSPSKLQRLPTIRRWFRPVKRFDDTQLRYGGTFPILLYERTGQPAVCQWEGSPPQRRPTPGGARQPRPAGPRQSVQPRPR